MGEIVDISGKKFDDNAEPTAYAEGCPVTKVYCDEVGIVCYEREGAASIPLGSTPGASRLAALRRCDALLEYCKHNSNTPSEYTTKRTTRISPYGKGVTYAELADQTLAACKTSKVTRHKRR